jgi:ribonucleoside-triphosphate reductase
MTNRTEVRIDARKIINEYMEDGDVAKENANQNKGPSGLLMAVGSEGLRRNTLKEMVEEGFGELVEMHNKGKVHLHDLGMGTHTPYCCGNSLPDLLNNGIEVGIKAAPAKHFNSAINHMVNFIGSMSNDYSGAQAFNGVDTYLAPYAYKRYLDFKKSGCAPATAFKLTREEVYQAIQNFVFHLNFNTRYGSQPPFGNITLDITVPPDMKDQVAMVAGKPIKEFYDYTVDGVRVNNHTHADLWEWQRLVAEAFIDTFNEGDANGVGFTFPVLTLNVEDTFFDHPLTDKICEFTAKYGIPFFQNFVNGVGGGEKLSPQDTRALCCRLSLSLKDIAKSTGGLFGNSDGTGSLVVVTVNLPYLACESRGDIKRFYKDLYATMEKIKEYHIWKRGKVVDAYNKGFLALSKKALPKGYDTFFTTVGFIGTWECVEMLTKDEQSLLTKEGLALGKDILQGMVDKTKSWMEEYKMLWNVEETPAESASYKLAKKSLKQFPNIVHRGLKKAPYFTNGCNIPVEFQDDLSQVLKVRTVLQPIPTGGTATHFYIGEEWSVEQTKEFIRMICNTPIPYFSISTVYSICPICGYHVGAHSVCPNNHTEEEINELRKTNPELIIE